MRSLLFIILLCLKIDSGAQVFWTENFNNGCTSGCGAAGVNTGNGAWSVTNAVTVTEGASANQWYVSCAENGMPANTCGAGCGSNASLHISAIGALCGPPDCGAAYNAGGACTTSKRVESPTINSTGYSGIVVGFNYIENGENTLDDASMYYSIDNGATWNLQVNMAKSSCCSILSGAPVACSNLFAGQGYWKALSTTLPSTCDNITTLKIGFLWINNGNNAGKDPSIAIDDVTLSNTAVLPISLSEFSARQKGKKVTLSWSTLSEEKFRGFTIQRSEDAVGFYDVAFIPGAPHNSYSKRTYAFEDNSETESGKIIYYRLKLSDKDGSFQYSNVNPVSFSELASGNIYTINANKDIVITSGYLQTCDNAELINSGGQIIRSLTPRHFFSEDSNSCVFPASDLAPGLYILRASGISEAQSFKIIIP